MMLLCVIQFTRFTNYTDAAELLDRAYNDSEFPSSWFTLNRPVRIPPTYKELGAFCMYDDNEEENVDDLTDEEKANRLKYNYVYNMNGTKLYPFRPNYFYQKRQDDIQGCDWKYYKGECIVTAVKNDEWHEGFAVVNFQFNPQMSKQTAADLIEEMKINYFNPSYDFVIKNQLLPGEKFSCTKRKLLRGDCPKWDFDFDGLVYDSAQQDEDD